LSFSLLCLQEEPLATKANLLGSGQQLSSRKAQRLWGAEDQLMAAL